MGLTLTPTLTLTLTLTRTLTLTLTLGADGQQEPDELRREVGALRHELALLRRTVVSGFSELKEAVAQQRA